MKLTKDMFQVLSDIEYMIGSECYNPNSYDGWNDIEGCDFRYPVNVPVAEEEYTKIRGSVMNSALLDQEALTEKTFKYMKYKFGSNELFIGLGIINTLEYLEKRYGLDFNELEKQLKK